MIAIAILTWFDISDQLAEFCTPFIYLYSRLCRHADSLEQFMLPTWCSMRCCELHCGDQVTISQSCYSCSYWSSVFRASTLSACTETYNMLHCDFLSNATRPYRWSMHMPKCMEAFRLVTSILDYCIFERSGFVSSVPFNRPFKNDEPNCTV